MFLSSPVICILFYPDCIQLVVTSTWEFSSEIFAGLYLTIARLSYMLWGWEKLQRPPLFFVSVSGAAGVHMLLFSIACFLWCASHSTWAASKPFYLQMGWLGETLRLAWDNSLVPSHSSHAVNQVKMSQTKAGWRFYTACVLVTLLGNWSASLLES